MLNLTFITTAPAMIDSYFGFGIGRALVTNRAVNLTILNLRDFATDKHGTVDDKPYGGGEGMVLKVDTLMNALKACPESSRVILPSPRGKVWHHEYAKNFLLDGNKSLVFICPRFSGVDERFIALARPEQISLGDFILSMGELAALALADSMLRFVPGSMGDAKSSEDESFSDAFGGKLEHPLYTRPPTYEGMTVPADLLSGDHARISKWKHSMSDEITKLNRPDLIQEGDNHERK